MFKLDVLISVHYTWKCSCFVVLLHWTTENTICLFETDKQKNYKLVKMFILFIKDNNMHKYLPSLSQYLV